MLLYGVVFLLFSNFYLTENVALEWTDSNFEANLAAKKVAFVMFYAPWCGHCKKLKPIWDELGSKQYLAKDAAIVKVDCTEGGKKICQEYKVEGYPTLKLLKKANNQDTVITYDGGRTLSELETYITAHTQPAYVELSDSKVESFTESSHLPSVVGYFKNTKSKLYEKLISLSSEHREYFSFGFTLSEDAAKKMKQKQDTVVIYKQVHFQTKMDDSFVSTSDAASLESLLENSRLTKVDIRVPKNEKLFKQPLVVVYSGININLQKSTFRQFRNKILKAEKKFSGTSFAVSFYSEYEKFMEDVGVTSSDNALHIVAFDKESQKFVCNVPMTLKDLKGFEETLNVFVKNFLAGDVYTPFIKSEQVPTSNDAPVKIVVAKNFKEIVLDSGKDVFLEVYAPWCGHCKKLEPIFTKLGETLAEEEKLVIAKMDATANEAQPNFPVSGFPTIFFVKAGEKDKPKVYDGGRDVKSMVNWLKEQASFPIKFDGVLPDAKEEL